LQFFSQRAIDVLQDACDWMMDDEDLRERAETFEEQISYLTDKILSSEPGPGLYEDLRRYELTLSDTISDWANEGRISYDELVCGMTIGFTDSALKFQHVNPENLGILRLAARRGARVDFVNEECEIRFRPEDVVITGVYRP
jgi:hypothetical protein